MKDDVVIEEFEIFKEKMEEKYKKAFKKPGFRSEEPWKDLHSLQLRQRLKEEFQEFLDSCHWVKNSSAIAWDKEELLDIANFCMFMYFHEP